MKQTLGQTMRTARSEKGLSLKEMADLVGDITFSALAQIERDEVRPKLTTLQRICRAYGISADEALSSSEVAA